ncbi:tripartite tricarboxylate transporter substrate binding protein [Ramlibacter sp. AW1]|uniref:Tripartite tricarboxylate transporter substrate binding protein n=1 Tax=Ramlibacter aurantiacus TaxID=2801330 RepID=A0A936ZT60_9BURK|nr:tripartite tricarboxylate transporter substrate binding protein [Ramlibacter aurantiacus]MBL0420690.1 tripartite tricarboxylate transporter substrate binding protein [Ramlibacter aurantiacus]
MRKPTSLSLTRRQATAGALLSLLPWSGAAFGQEAFPSRPVKFVNWSNPGGNLDILGRLMADQASRKWGQPVITENRVGAAGIIATEYVAKSPADGYTVLITSSTGQLTNALVKLKLPFDPVKDFEPLSLLVAGNIALMAAANAPYNNLKELVAYAKKLNRPLTYGSPARGTSSHLYGEAFARQAGIQMTHVPYKTGELGAMNDIIGGNLDLTLMSQGNAKTHSQSGRVKLLAISGDARSKALPELPTFKEQGYTGFGLAGWIAAYVPAGTPRPVVAKIASTFQEILQQPDVAARLDGLGYEVIGSSPEQLRAFYQEEYKRIGEMVKNAGITPE